MEHFVLLFEENILVRCGNWNQQIKRRRVWWTPIWLKQV